MIDVMHVISGLGTGGAETMLVQVARALQTRGLSQHVISLSALDAHSAELRAAGIGVTVLKAGSMASVPGTAAALVQAGNKLRPRILQGWMYHGNIAATLVHYLCPGRRNRNLFWNLRASNMDAGRYGRIIRWSALLSGLPHTIIVNSEAGAAFHRQHGFRPQRVLVIDNGVDTEKFRPDPAARAEVRTELGIADGTLVVIHLARVDPMKDHHTFLAAMERLPSAIGLMVGYGTERLPRPANVRALGLRTDTARLIAAADVVVSTSAFGEGFSNVIAEGMSAGLVPVATDVGDARRIIGDTGFVISPGDTGALIAAIAKEAGSARAERVSRGRRARARIVEKYGLPRALECYERLYSA